MKPISKNQMADFWAARYAPRGECMLCGGPGLIDTRGKVFDHEGRDCGGRAYCICPNGRAIEKMFKLAQSGPRGAGE